MKKVLISLILLLCPFFVLAQEQSVVDITTLSMNEIQEYVDKGYLTYEKIVNIYLDRIEKYNGQYNAILNINKDAIKQAQELDKEYKEKGRRSQIFGLPIVVKDNIDVKGLPTTAGTKALKDNYPNENAPIVQKLIDAGAIVIGKTNMSEFAFSATDSYSSYGHVKNAYNTLYSSYGSSGGTAVAVASGLAVAGLGTDTGSSIRIPSAAAGLVGLRPTINSVDMNGIIKFESTRDVAGPITKYVEDNAIMYSIINKDSNTYEAKEESLKGIKIGVIKGFMNPNTNSIAIATGITDINIYNLMQESIKKLEELGAEIVEIDGFGLPYQFNANGMCYDFNQYIKNTTGPIKNYQDLINNGGYVNGLAGYNYNCDYDYTKSSTFKTYLNFINNNVNTANKKFENTDVDVMIYPTLKTTLLKLSELYSRKLYTPSSSVAPLVGFPSMNVQIGFYDDLPYGMEILSQRNNEQIIYKIAYNLQLKNNYYKLPTIAPILYTINKNTDKLLKYYEENKSEKEYKTIKEKMKNYINNYDNNEETINSLILEYEEVPAIIKSNRIKLYGGLFLASGIILVLVFIGGKKHEKTKRAH